MAVEKVVEVIESAQEIVEETLDVLEAIPAWRCGLSRKQHFAQLVAVGVIATAAGGFVAFHVSRKRLKNKYEALAKKEIAQAKDFYSAVYKKDEYATPEQAVEQLHGSDADPAVRDAAEAIRLYQGKDVATPAVEVFVDQVLGETTITADPEIRDENAPYIISHEEFLNADPGYDQHVLTYFSGDDTLANESDEPIELVEALIGPDTLQRFGELSGDPNTVYVRNNTRHLDFEIVKSEGKFSHEVAGLMHSDAPYSEKFKQRGGNG